MIKAIVVDDEKGARESLSKMIEKKIDDIEIVAKADSMKTAYEAISNLQPDLVFLDIEMPNGNAFDLLSKFTEIYFDIIFTTAFDHYAIKAIKFSAIDYLLKPIDAEDLIEAVNRFRNKTKKNELLDKKIKALLSNINSENKSKKFGISEGEGIVFVTIDEIARCEAMNSYTMVVMEDKREMMVTKTLNDFEILFSEFNFIRVHRTHLVNPAHIKKYFRGNEAYLIMDDDTQIPVSRTGKVILSTHFFKQ